MFNIAVPYSINSDAQVPLIKAFLINTILLGCFIVQHLFMAREKFKLWFSNKFPIFLERSTFSLFASFFIILLLWHWQPIPTMVWDINMPALSIFLRIVALCGWLFAFYSTFMIDHFQLFGLRQTFLYFRNKKITPISFKIRGPYKHVRYPILLGYCVAFWATSKMTVGHLMFSISMSLLIFIGIYFKDKEFHRQHPKKFQAYKKRAYTIIPLLPKNK
jgi:protein-S-isoprenylcysteine O-methyltransferase Ste14